MAADIIANSLTVGLGAVTAWMAWETRRMAAATQATLELSAAPALALHAFDVKPMIIVDGVTGAQTAGFRPVVVFRNPGHVRVTYDVKRIAFSLAGQSFPLGAFDNHTGVVHPGSEATFYLPMFPYATPLAPGMSGTFEIEVQYWAVPEARETLAFGFRYTIVVLTNDARRVEWVFTRGPTYT